MKIAAFSDWHGKSELPTIQEGTDIVVIAGDVVPANMQWKILKCEEWFKTTFFDWVKGLNVDKVLLVPGNHDIMFGRLNKERFLNEIKEADLSEKLILLIDDAYEYGGYNFYGTPWVKNLEMWVFSDATLSNYDKIPQDCDILISHMPPVVGKVGTSYPNTKYEIDYGAQELEEVLKERNVKYVFCGHIHTGTHGGVDLKTDSDTVTKVYNVSMVNEQYVSIFPVTYLELTDKEVKD